MHSEHNGFFGVSTWSTETWQDYMTYILGSMTLSGFYVFNLFDGTALIKLMI